MNQPISPTTLHPEVQDSECPISAPQNLQRNPTGEAEAEPSPTSLEPMIPAQESARKADQAERVAAYLAKRQARADRLLGRAARLEKEGGARLAAADRIMSFIPMGQPILVGHHSEKRHRRDLARIEGNMSKGYHSLQEAKRLREKALTVGANQAIFSDDPQATEKLEAKIQRLEQRQALMKAANKRIRAGASLLDLGFSEALAQKLSTPDWLGRTGFPDYALKNNNANIRRLKQRLQSLAKREEAEEPEDLLIHGVRIVHNFRENRVQMVFPSKPVEAVRDRLKQAGFRWSPFNGCWQRHYSDYAVQLAQHLATASAPSKEEG